MLETTKAFAAQGVTLKAVAQAVKGVPVYSLEAAYEPVQVPGLKATFVSECKTPESGQIDTNKVTLLYKRGEVTVEETVAYSKSKLAFATSVSLAHQAVRVGAQVLGSFAAGAEGDKKFQLDGYGAKLGYVPTGNLSLIANYERSAAAASAGATLYYRKDVTESAVQVVLDPQNPSKTPAFTFAVSHAYDVKTTLKARATTSNNAIAFSLRHQLTPALAVTVATETSGYVSKDAKPATAKHGIAINLKL